MECTRATLCAVVCAIVKGWVPVQSLVKTIIHTRGDGRFTFQPFHTTNDSISKCSFGTVTLTGVMTAQ